MTKVSRVCGMTNLNMNMNWNTLQNADQLTDLIIESNEKDVLIFKHSTRCSISKTTLDRLERNWKETEIPNVKPYLVDLLTFRELSNAIATRFGVEHQSPQVLIISKGQSRYDRSHFDIDYHQIKTVTKS
jgi:bacillithiol system protein YtxJ